MSAVSQQLSCQSSKKCTLFRQFQEKVDEAGLIIFVLSNDFAKSCFTRKQVSIFRSNNYSFHCDGNCYTKLFC